MQKPLLPNFPCTVLWSPLSAFHLRTQAFSFGTPLLCLIPLQGLWRKQMLWGGSDPFCTPVESSQSSRTLCKGKLDLEILKYGGCSLQVYPAPESHMDILTVGTQLGGVKAEWNLVCNSANACSENHFLPSSYDVDLLLNQCFMAEVSLLSLCHLTWDSYWMRPCHISIGLCIYVIWKQ